MSRSLEPGIALAPRKKVISPRKPRIFGDGLVSQSYGVIEMYALGIGESHGGDCHSCGVSFALGFPGNLRPHSGVVLCPELIPPTGKYDTETLAQVRRKQQCPGNHKTHEDKLPGQSRRGLLWPGERGFVLCGGPAK